MKRLFIIFLFYLCLLTGCAYPNIKNQTIPQVDSSYKLEKDMAVSARTGWQDSEIMLREGQKFIIRASGLWNKGFAPDCGPDGYIGSAGEIRYNSEYGAMSLLGKIGNEKEFLIGSYVVMVASSSGELSFRPNCADIGFWDNSGGVIASIYLPKVYNAQDNAAPLKVETVAKSVDVLIKGYSPGGKSRQQDYQEALLNAKLQAIERAGIDISSYTKVENFVVTHDLIESKAQAVLEPGFQVIDMGYQSDGSFLVILSGRVTTSKVK
ncbi:MAG: hypothetical protein NTX75_08325 [Proteobacteria bacterium]|nr:hypothetical protein [Pseudomonadota bacterium]